MQNSNVILTGFLTLLLAACNSGTIFQEEKNIPTSGWMYRDSLDFNFKISDTSAIYNLYVDVAHADTFAAQNLYVKLYTRFPDGKRPGKTVSLDLFDAAGAPVGKCSGQTCAAHILLQENAYFATPGDYGLTIHQFMRRDSLPGIQSVGFSIEKTGQKR